VTTGFNIAGVIFPLLFGALMDHGYAREIFILSAVCCVASVIAVLAAGRKPVAA
jgi:hypothetical protein